MTKSDRAVRFSTSSSETVRKSRVCSLLAFQQCYPTLREECLHLLVEMFQWLAHKDLI